MATAPTEIRVTPEIAAEHGLTTEEYARVKQILGREPNIAELGIFSVMRSEHCSYKSSKVHLKRLPTRGKLGVEGRGENAGVVEIGDGLVGAFKIESHNHPSYVEPFQGATTGVGGILRDIFTMGARPIAVLDSLRFGEISASKFASEEDAAKNCSILGGGVRGVGSYGNCYGVPTGGGEVGFEPCYSQNPLVNALALGIAKKEEIFLAKAKGIGNPVIYVGAKTGRDGIHGASLLASAEFTEESKQKRPNVQVGDPFMEKLLLEACLEAMQTGAVVAIQDMGAAGLTCSPMEMASRGGTGIEIDLAKVPQRETGMTPYEIMLSESQERMLLVAEKGREYEVLAVFKKWGLDAVVVGQVTEGGIARINNNAKLAAEIPAHPLAEEAPVYTRHIAATNCLNFGSPEKPEVMWQFSETIDGLAEACTALGTPITGGNVSFYNETLGKSIYPTPVIGVLGVIEEASHVLKIAFRNEGDVILLLDPSVNVGANFSSPSSDARANLACQFSSSEYSKTIAGIVAGEPPAIDVAAEKRLQDCLVALAAEGTLQSAHDISDGGLAVTLAESSFASESSLVGAQHAAPHLGANIKLDGDASAEFALFGESGARAIVSVAPSSLAAVLNTARQYKVAARELGQVTRDGSFRIEHKGRAVIDSSVETLRDAWTNSLERAVKNA